MMIVPPLLPVLLEELLPGDLSLLELFLDSLALLVQPCGLLMDDFHTLLLAESSLLLVVLFQEIL